MICAAIMETQAVYLCRRKRQKCLLPEKIVNSTCRKRGGNLNYCLPRFKKRLDYKFKTFIYLI
jgi:hypothetical protein